MKHLILLLVMTLCLPVMAADDSAFAALLDEHWQRTGEEKVFFRTENVAGQYSGPLADLGGQAIKRRERFNQQVLERLAQLDPAAMSPENRISYRAFLYERETERDSYRQPDHYYLITNRDGWHNAFATAPAGMSFSSVDDYRLYLQTLADFPRYNEQHIVWLKAAVFTEHTQFCASMEGFEHSISAHLVDEPEQSVFYQPLADMPQTIAPETAEQLRQQARQLISAEVLPAYQQLLDFYLAEYQPNCRQNEGIYSREGGAAYYDYLVRFYTTTEMSPIQIHQLGLREVERIRAAMQQAIARSGFSGSFAEFLNFLRSDPQFYVDSAEDLLEKAAWISKRMDGRLPALFGVLPRLPYDVRAIPDSIAEKTTGAYYSPSSGDGRTPGSYYVNTSLLASRPLYTLEALTFHEAVPGHHLQTALALESEMPEFRRFLYYSAFGEGWALYAESLGQEAGFYRDVYSDFGRLTYEMWRAQRLVVDTGLHAFGWTRQQAIDFMSAGGALSLHEITSEVDRYITWPGQALSYKVGELSIKALRREAEQAMGEHFDLRAFHDKVLENGSVPIALLEQLVHEWIEQHTRRGAQ